MIPAKITVAARPILADHPLGGRDVGGSQPFEYGWIGQPAGWGDKTRAAELARRQLEESDAAIAEMQRKMRADAMQLEFEERSSRRQLLTAARASVQSGLRAAEVRLQQRRGRLRELLQQEDSALTAEFVERMLRADTDKLQSMRARVAEDRARHDAEARELAEAKRLQQYRLRIDDLRSQKSRVLAREAVQCQLRQMEERECLRMREREEERFWAEVMRKEVQAKMAREEQDERERAERNREMREALDKQVAGLARQREQQQQLRQEQMRHNEHVLRQLKQEQQGLAEELEKRREQLAAELQEQIATRQRFLDEARRQEEVVDETFARMTEEALRREKAQQLDLSASLRREQQLFRENLEEMRQRKMAEERELDRLLEEEQQRMRERQDAMRARARDARRQLMEGVLSERAQQVGQRQRQRELDAEQQRAERQMGEQLRRANDQLTEEHRRRRAELQRQYGRELREQAEVARRMREAERAEYERQWRAGLLAEEAYLRKVEELLALGATEPGYPPHPFLAVAEGQATAAGGAQPGAGDQAEDRVKECLCPEAAAKEREQQQEEQRAAGDRQQLQQQEQQQQAAAEGGGWDPRVCHCHDA